ncbi:hypothetical protein PPACK8108_LOCUS2234 [Phakopsora pachyrhizi]|uniref:Transcription initiation factor IIF subunit alpha n=1 Tax=Phakopsora pachyrhizi TaxID=170000 RepID=A0AAV0AHE6_PHAPC|nr:hypothetical protein PPACK8108_LOCUS2234 [Phakopsora pachyrhizi]
MELKSILLFRVEKDSLKIKLHNGDEDLDPVNRKNSSNATNLQQQQSNKPTRDESLVAPAPASQPKLKTQAFKKKTKQVFIASDQLARMLKREEYQSCLLEDSLTGGEKWIGRFESAGAGSGPASSAATTGSSKVPTYKASNYVVFCLDKNGENFTILPCHRFNKFTHCPNYDTLGPEEAEAAYEKMQKTTTKEDVGRWFMQLCGAAASSNSMNPINQSTGNSSSIGISTSDFKQKQSLKPSIFDESKISLGSASRPQVKAVSVFGGRKGKFTAVHGGGNLMGKDEDEDVKPKLGQDGDFDEVDYDEEFANDEEGAGNLNDEAMEEDELWELDERMKWEMLAAGRAGDEEKDRDNMIVDKDDLFGKRDNLTKKGKAVKKLLMRKADNNDAYNSDDDVKNPYASEEEESDMEEVNPINPLNNGNLADTSTHPDSQSGTPAPGLNNANSSTQSRNLSKVALSRISTIVKLPENPRSRPPSRADTPSLAASSPQPQPARKNQASLPIGSSNNNLANQRLTSPPAAFGTPSGAKRKHPGGVTGKEKRQNQCLRSGSPLSTADHQQQLTSSATSRTGSNSAGATGGNVKSLGPITEEEVVKLLKTRKVSSKELLTHFKVKLREEGNQQTLFGIVKRVATIVNGQITIK